MSTTRESARSRRSDYAAAGGDEHLERVLSWCEAVGVKHVTIYLCSTENLQRRGDAEVAHFMLVVEQVMALRLARPDACWQVHIAGMLDLLPAGTANALKDAVEATRTCTTGAHVTLAVGYGGRQGVVGGARDHLAERAEAGDPLADLAESLTMEIGRAAAGGR